jgi:hypothetical protein
LLLVVRCCQSSLRIPILAWPFRFGNMAAEPSFGGPFFGAQSVSTGGVCGRNKADASVARHKGLKSQDDTIKPLHS